MLYIASMVICAGCLMLTYGLCRLARAIDGVVNETREEQRQAMLARPYWDWQHGE